jgi:hypothetical protein
LTKDPLYKIVRFRVQSNIGNIRLIYYSDYSTA